MFINGLLLKEGEYYNGVFLQIKDFHQMNEDTVIEFEAVFDNVYLNIQEKLKLITEIVGQENLEIVQFFYGTRATLYVNNQPKVGIISILNGQTIFINPALIIELAMLDSSNIKSANKKRYQKYQKIIKNNKPRTWQSIIIDKTKNLQTSN